MRSAEYILRAAVVAAAASLLGGCVAISDFRTAFGSDNAAPPAPAPVSTATATPTAAEAKTAVKASEEPAGSDAIATPVKADAPLAEASVTPSAAAPATATAAATTAAAPAATTAAMSATAAAAEPKPPQPPAPPVDAAVQRAFDDARRALTAGKTVEAERGFLALTKSHPELGGSFANLGLIYRQAGKLNEAVAQLEQAVHASPMQPIFFNELGIAYRLRGNFDKARDAYEQALVLDPNYAAAHLNLGILYDIYLWDGARALEHYDRYLALSPGGDEKVKKWVADLKNRGRQQSMLTKQEKP